MSDILKYMIMSDILKYMIYLSTSYAYVWQKTSIILNPSSYLNNGNFIGLWQLFRKV